VAKVEILWTTRYATKCGAKSHPSWKHRHDVVFRRMRPSVERLIAACNASVQLWSCRVPRKPTSLYNFWSSLRLM
jgi:hypothetical protein